MSDPTEDRRCRLGHRVESAQLYCGECGARTEPVAAVAPERDAPDGTVEEERAASELRDRTKQLPSILRRYPIPAAGVAILALLLIVALLRVGSEQQQDFEVPAASASPERDCMDEVADWAGALDDGKATIHDVAREFGTESPKFRLIMDVFYTFRRESYRVGRKAALEGAGQKTLDGCRQIVGTAEPQEPGD